MANLPLQASPRVVTTVGETFADGSVLELVTSASSGRLRLLLYSAGKQKKAKQVEYSHRIYQPPNLDAAIVRAIRFPHDAKPYGSTKKLLCRIRELFERHAGLLQPESALLTAWAKSSWFPDCLSSPPTLLISATDMGRVVELFRLLHCVCRRPVILGDINRSAFLSLASLGATLLINQPSLPARIRDLWSTSNYRGVHVFGNGQLRSAASSKAVFFGMTEARDNEGLHFALPPAHGDLSPLNEQQQTEIAEELQPQLLMFRLRNFDKVRNFSPSPHGSTFMATGIARNLVASVLGETETVEAMTPLLQRLEQDKSAQLSCDVHRAMIEVTWAPSHEDREISISRLTELTNTLLRCRGELLEYGTAEIGWKLRNLGFDRHRNGKGMVLRFSHENRLLIHQLAVAWSLKLGARAGCALCSPQESVDSKEPM